MFGLFKWLIGKSEDELPVYDDPDPYDCACDTDDFCHDCGDDDADDDWDDDDD